MSCNHDTVTNINLDEPKCVLVYCEDKMIQAGFVINEVSSAHKVEVFDTAQEVIDRGLSLGLTCSVDHMISAMENSAVLPDEVMDYLHSVIWDMDLAYGERMEALGHSKPE